MRNKLTARYIRSYKFQTKTIVDIGVLNGTRFLYNAFPDAKFVLIDPLEESKVAVAKKYKRRLDYDFHLMAVSDKAGVLDLAVEPDAMASSSLGDKFFNRERKKLESRKVPVAKLDAVLESYTGPFGLKIDTEGHELDVLKGATETLKNCEFVIAEVSIKRRFTDGYKFSDIIAYMASQGFEPHSFMSGLTRSPRMSDVLFLPFESPRFDMG